MAVLTVTIGPTGKRGCERCSRRASPSGRRRLRSRGAGAPLDRRRVLPGDPEAEALLRGRQHGPGGSSDPGRGLPSAGTAGDCRRGRFAALWARPEMLFDDEAARPIGSAPSILRRRGWRRPAETARRRPDSRALATMCSGAPELDAGLRLFVCEIGPAVRAPSPVASAGRTTEGLPGLNPKRATVDPARWTGPIMDACQARSGRSTSKKSTALDRADEFPHRAEARASCLNMCRAMLGASLT